jgi:hypothetical protein
VVIRSLLVVATAGGKDGGKAIRVYALNEGAAQIVRVDASRAEVARSLPPPGAAAAADDDDDDDDDDDVEEEEEEEEDAREDGDADEEDDADAGEEADGDAVGRCTLNSVDPLTHSLNATGFKLLLLHILVSNCLPLKFNLRHYNAEEEAAAGDAVSKILTEKRAKEKQDADAAGGGEN